MSRFLWKIDLLSLFGKKWGFHMQNSLSNILEVCIEFIFCAKFDLNNYRYCDIGLQTKYTLGIVQDIFPKIPSIQYEK
jgi:hypothetical protein